MPDVTIRRASPLPSSPAERRRSPAAPPPDARLRRVAPWLAVALPAVAAAVLAGVGLAARSLWLDEGASIAIAAQHGGPLWHAVAHDGGNMLAYYLLLHEVVTLFGPGPVAARLPSVVAAAAAAALTARLALRLFARPLAAGAAGLLTAVSLPLVFWGQNARGYAPVVALTAASWLALASILATPDGHRASRAAVGGYLLATLLSLYFSYDVVLVVPAQLFLLLLRRGQARAVVGTLVVVALACLPLAVLALRRGSGQLFWVPGLGGRSLGQAGATLVSAGLLPNFHYVATVIPLAALTALVVLIGAACLVARCGARRWEPWLPAVWLFVPLVLGLAVAAANEPVELARATVLLLPALALMLAWTLVALPAEVARPAAAASGAAVLVALVVLRALSLAPTYGVSPEDWRAAADYLTTHSTRGACVAFYPQDGRMPFDLYVRDLPGARRLRPVLPPLSWREVRPFVERYAAPRPAALARGCAKLWLVASHQGERTGTPASQANLRRYRRLLSGLARRYRHSSHRRFGYAAVVWVTRFWR